MMQLYDFEGGKIWLDVQASEMQELMSKSQWEWRKTAYMRQHLKPGMVFADVGAFNGYFSLIAAKLVGESGRVFSFEPNPDNIHLFEMNKHENILPNNDLYPIALHDHDGTMSLYWAGARSSSIPVPLNYGFSDARCRRLDDVLPNVAVDMMKIDTEGMEAHVLHGAQGVLSQKRPVYLLMDLHPELGIVPREVEKLLSFYDFKLFDIRGDFAPIERIPGDLVELLAVK